MKKQLILPGASILLVISFALTVILVGACSKSSNNNTPVAGLMTFNLAPDRPGIVITLSGIRLPGFPLYYQGYSGVYLSIFAANRSVVTYDYLSGIPIASSVYNFEPDKYYSQFLVGANNNYGNLVVGDNLDSLSAKGSGSGKAYIRFVNGIPDSSKPLVTLTSGGTAVIRANAGFPTVSGFVAVAPGPVNISVTNGGTINATRTINTEQANVYTILLTGLPNPPDPGRAVQIKYIINGTLSNKAAKKDSANVLFSN